MSKFDKGSDELVDYGHDYSQLLSWIKNRKRKKEYRYEVKFISYDTRRNDFLYWLKDSKFGFKKAYSDKQINNIYFDTRNLDMLNENIAGISQRKKVRYRWYGENEGPTKGNLEIKNKRNNLGWKDVYHVALGPYKKGSNWTDVIVSIKKQVPERAIAHLNICTDPVLINRYYREYYESADRKLRVTIDRNQEFYKQHSFININFTYKKHTPNLMTVEMKCNYQERERASELLRNIPLRYSRYSKFVNGMI